MIQARFSTNLIKTKNIFKTGVEIWSNYIAKILEKWELEIQNDNDKSNLIISSTTLIGYIVKYIKEQSLNKR